MLWECSAYSSSRADFLLKLQEKLGNGFECFDALDSLGKSSFILGSELWEENFDSLFALVKDYVVNIWEARKIKLYGDDSSQSQSSAGDLGEVTGIEGQSGKNMCQGGKPDSGKFHSSYIGVAPPLRMGAWSMARVLRQRIEYYYYYYFPKYNQVVLDPQTLHIVQAFKNPLAFLYLERLHS